jgi:hypothetical protein
VVRVRGAALAARAGGAAVNSGVREIGEVEGMGLPCAPAMKKTLAVSVKRLRIHAGRSVAEAE